MIDGLKDKHRDEIIEVLASNDRVERAILFGSRETETFTAGSDVDIALFGEGLTMTDQGRLAAVLEESTIPQRIALLLHDRIDNDALREHIRRHGIEWYRRPKDAPAARLHLPLKHRRTLEALLRKHLPGVEVWAYGSRVNGRNHDGSDLDLVLRGPELKETPADKLADFEDAIRDSTIPFLVEARDWTRLPARFHREVERDHVVLVSKEVQYSGGSWPTTRLGDCIEINVSTYAPSEFWPFINYLDTGNITENRIAEIQLLVTGKNKIPSRARRKVQPGDIVYSTVRSNQKHFGLLKDIPENFLASTDFAVIRGKSGLGDTDFIYWFLTQDHIVDRLHTIAEHSTSAYPSIKPADIEQLDVDLPSLPEQRAIAHILGTLDDKIELNRRMNETLEAMARAVFKDWFVDFGPTRAKAEDRKPYLASELWDLFPDVLNDEGNPMGWKQGTLAEIADSPRRGVGPADIADSTPYIGLEHMPRRSIALSEWGGAGNVKSNKSVFQRGGVLFGKLRPYFHKVGLASLDGICSTDIVVVVPRESEWGTFTLACLSSDDFVDYTDQTSTGTKMPRTSWKTMGQYEICLPPIQVVRVFQDLVQPLLDLVCANIDEASTLVQTRHLLLPKLMSGEISVSDAERVMEVVA